MDKEKVKVSLKQYVETKEAVRYLEELVKGLKAGCIEVRQGDESLVLTAPDMLELEMEAKQKKDKSKFVLELSWKAAPVMAEAPAAEGKPEEKKAAEKKPEAAAKPAEAPKPAEKPADKPADKGPKK